MDRAFSHNGVGLLQLIKIIGNRSLGRPKRRWVDNIRTDSKRNKCHREKFHKLSSYIITV